jgi:type IV secretory pathway VirB2 component (pilin)
MYAKWLTAAQAVALSGIIVLGVAVALARTGWPVLLQRRTEA